MSIVKSRKEFYLQQQVNREKGIINGIPWYLVFPKLGAYIPTIPRGYQILWTANSGVGKTQTWIGIILYSIYKLKKEHPELNLKVKLVIALLEDTKEMFIDRLYSMILHRKYGLRIDGFTLQSLKDTPLNKEIIPLLDEVEKEIEELLSDCEIIDSIYNPTGLYKWTRSITNKYGTHHQKEMEFTHTDGSTSIEKVYSHYTQHDPDMQFVMIVDNLNNLATESIEGKRTTQLETINRWSRDYCRLQITKHFKWTVINVIQQASDSEKQQFTYKGDTIVEKLKPSLDGLGNSKECQRDHFLIFGIFAPARYGIDTYPEGAGYNITRMKDNYRSLIILKSNLSESNIEIPFYFDGSCSFLKELPKPVEMTEEIYKKVETKTVKP
jgi:hypothetical protein